MAGAAQIDVAAPATMAAIRVVFFMVGSSDPVYIKGQSRYHN
jgi:hypothetical protein